MKDIKQKFCNHLNINAEEHTELPEMILKNVFCICKLFKKIINQTKLRSNQPYVFSQFNSNITNAQMQNQGKNLPALSTLPTLQCL